MKSIKWQNVVMVTVGALLVFSISFAAGITAREIIEKVQAKYDDMSDVVLTFSQSVRFKVSKAEQQMSGTLYFKKKNKYRIETEERTVVTDGKTSWSYNPRNNQVILDNYKEEAHSLSPEQLLVKYPRDYYSSLVGEEKVGQDNCYILKLTPKEDNTFATGLKIWVNQKWYIRKVEVTDINGALSTYTIKEFNIDKGIPDSKFEYKLPTGADVIDLR